MDWPRRTPLHLPSLDPSSWPLESRTLTQWTTGLGSCDVKDFIPSPPFSSSQRLQPGSGVSAHSSECFILGHRFNGPDIKRIVSLDSHGPPSTSLRFYSDLPGLPDQPLLSCLWPTAARSHWFFLILLVLPLSRAGSFPGSQEHIRLHKCNRPAWFVQILTPDCWRRSWN